MRKRGPNQYRVDTEEACAYITIESRGAVVEAVIDLGDFDKVMERHWGLSTDGYPRNMSTNRKGTRGLSLHRLVMGDIEGVEYDHINRNKLDNRKENLRPCTRKQNCQNRGVRRDSKTGLKGVQKRAENVYRARIQMGEKRITIGHYPTPELAHEAYNQEAARLNLN